MQRVVLAAVMTLAAWCAAADNGAYVFVSTSGNDAWSGRVSEPNADKSDGPAATLARARDLLRAAGPGMRGVYVRGGNYFLREPLALTKEDSGTPEHVVAWQAFPGETVRLSGGAAVAGFTPHSGNILKADVSALNVPEGKGRQFFFNGERQTLARWPNKGEGEVPGGKWAFIAGSVDAEKSRSFHYAGDRPGQWKNLKDVEVSIWPNYNWWQTIAPVAAIDAAVRKVTLGGDLSYTIEPGRRYYFQNVFEELDAPGEWYLDAASHTLYFWPPAAVEGVEAVLPVAEGIVRMDGAAHIAWLGFTMETVTGDAVAINNCDGCLVGSGVIRNAGGYGAVVKGGTGCKVAGCDITGTGRGGIVLDGGDRKTLTPGRHVADNNHIWRVAELWQTYETGVNIGGVGNHVSNNLIHDLPHIGVLLTGNDHTIECNEIHHVCLQGSDNGAFYMGRDWTQRGVKVQFNRIHDVYGFGFVGAAEGEPGKYVYASPHQSWGVYLDDCTSGVTVLGNLFYRVPLCGVMIGGGRDNVVDNNVFVDCVPALHIDDRWDAYCWDLMKERLDAMNPSQPPYSERWPELLKMGDDPRKPANNQFVRNVVAYARDDYRGLSTTKPGSAEAVVYNLSPFDPESTVFSSNIIFHPTLPKIFCRSYKKDDGAVIEWMAWKDRGFDKDSELADPRFMNAAADDYTMKQNSPAFKMKDLKAVPEWRMGLYNDEFRASWPPPKQEIKDESAHREWTVAPE